MCGLKLQPDSLSKIHFYLHACDWNGWLFKVICLEVQQHITQVGHLSIIPVIGGQVHSQGADEIPNQ